MNEISTDIQAWIIKLVKKQKKIELSFISAATEVSEKDLIANAEKMGLYTDGECFFCPSHPDVRLLMSEKEKIPLSEIHFRKITDDFVFCPKCGKKNSFSFGVSGEEPEYYCAYCHNWLNYYWKEYQHGKLLLVICDKCMQNTFDQEKYCITCGSVQKTFKLQKQSARIKSKTQIINKPFLLILVIPSALFVLTFFICFIICARTPNSIDSIWTDILFGLVIFGIPIVIGLTLIVVGIYAIYNSVRKRRLKLQINSE